MKGRKLLPSAEREDRFKLCLSGRTYISRCGTSDPKGGVAAHRLHKTARKALQLQKSLQFFFKLHLFPFSGLNISHSSRFLNLPVHGYTAPEPHCSPSSSGGGLQPPTLRLWQDFVRDGWEWCGTQPDCPEIPYTDLYAQRYSLSRFQSSSLITISIDCVSFTLSTPYRVFTSMVPIPRLNRKYRVISAPCDQGIVLTSADLHHIIRHKAVSPL